MKRKERKALNKRAKEKLTALGFIVEHERRHRQHMLWNIATDAVINGMLGNAAPHYRAFIQEASLLDRLKGAGLVDDWWRTWRAGAGMGKSEFIPMADCTCDEGGSAGCPVHDPIT